MKGNSGAPALRVVAALLLVIFVLLGRAFIDANSQTSDEAIHLVSGYSYLKTGSFRLNIEHPPLIKLLGALAVELRYHLPLDLPPRLLVPRSIGEAGLRFLYESPVPADEILATARLPNLLLGALLLAAVYQWSRRLWGAGAACLGMALAAFDPNLVAHSSLLTTDLGNALFTFLTLYLAWEHAQKPSLWRLGGVGVCLGLALVTKLSAIALPAILGVVVLAWVAAGGSPLGRRLVEAALSLLIAVAVAALLIPPAYFFHDVSYWWMGVRAVVLHAGQGHRAFYLGEYGSGGWPSYFLVALLIKTPIGSLLLILAGLIFVRAGRHLALRDAIFVVLPALLLLGLASLSNLNIGLRHVLPIYPLLFVAASRVATFRFSRAWLAPALCALALAWTATSSLWIAPHQLAYFNELIGGPRNGHLYLNDSNIDWGQDLKGLGRYLESRGSGEIYLAYSGNAPPAAYGIRYQPLPSWGAVVAQPDDVVPRDAPRHLLAINVFTLMGVKLPEPDAYKWLMSREPLERIGYSIWVFDITTDADAHVRLAALYLKTGQPERADLELVKALDIDPQNAEAKQLYMRRRS